MDPTTSNNVFCEACNITMHKNSSESHFNGKKHMIKQQQFDKVNKTAVVRAPSDPETSVFCEACNIYLHNNLYESHISGKKHLLKQNKFEMANKAVFVSGVSRLTPEDLKKIFQNYGEVSHILKQKNQPYAFVQFADVSSVEAVLKARIFAGKSLLFIHRYEERGKPANQNEKSRKHSDLSSNTSQPELAPGQVGVVELPVELPDPDQCPDPQTVFEWQVEQFVSQVELPADMYQLLDQVTSDVEILFCKQLPGSKVFVFGSCGSTLAFRNSDVDLFLQCVGGQRTEFVKKDAKVLYRSRLLNVTARIPSARVPIVKFEHIKTGWQCDLTAHSNLGVCNSRLIRFLISLDSRIRPLVMTVKYWAKVCGVTGSHQNLTTYSLVMLVIFYLQQLSPPILPPIAILQHLAHLEEFSNGWKCSFCDEQSKVKSEWQTEENTQTLRELLVGFFHYYDKFNFNNVVCPLLGYTVPVPDFEDPDKLPAEMLLYKENINKDPKLEFKRNVMLRVQDPFELCLNITRNVSDKTFFIFKKACSVSYELSSNNDDSSLLKSLFSIDKASLDVEDDYFKTHIPFKKVVTDPTLLESYLFRWYELTTEAILLVMREILKLSIEPNSVEVSSKVKKVESSQDVHTLPNNFKTSDHLNYICSGYSSIWTSRKKTSKVLTSLNIYLNDFEKEVCISNILYKPEDKCSFSFNLVLSSFDEFKKSTKGIDIIIKYKKSQEKSQTKELLHYLKYYFKFHITQALEFIGKTRESSSVTEVKESLKELFNLTLTKLSDLPSTLNEWSDEEDLEFTKMDDDKILRQQNLLLQSIRKENSIKKEPNEVGLDSQKLNEQKSLHLQNKTTDESIQEEENKADIISKNVDNISESSNINFEPVASTTPNAQFVNKVDTEENRNSNLTENVSDKSKEMIDDFLKADCPDQINVLNCNENSTNSVFCNMLTNLKKCETESSFTTDKSNPFLESLEKLTVIQMSTENKSIVCNDEMESLKQKNNETDEKISNNELNDQKNNKNEPMDYSSTVGKTSKREGGKNKVKPVTPKVCVERPHRYRKPNTQKPPFSTTHPSTHIISHAESSRPYRRKESRAHDQSSGTSNYKPPFPIVHQSKPLISHPKYNRFYKGKESRPYEHFSRASNHASSSNDYLYYDEYVANRRNHNEFYGSDKHQRELSLSLERQKMWYPRLFKNHF